MLQDQSDTSDTIGVEDKSIEDNNENDKLKKLDVLKRVLQLFELELDFVLRFSKRLKPFNAYARLYEQPVYEQPVKTTRVKPRLIVVVSYEWLNVSEDIFQGLLEDLLSRLFKHEAEVYRKNRANLLNIRLYNNFINQLSKVIARTNLNHNHNNRNYSNYKSNDYKSYSLNKHYLDSMPNSRLTPNTLIESFDRVNKEFFNNILEQPNLLFSGNSKRVLASYDYVSHTIRFSNIVKKLPKHLLDYIMLHELLHYLSGFRFRDKANRVYRYYHDKNFRLREKSLLASKGLSRSALERELSKYLKTKA